jgi:hypothetical protein
MQCQICGKYHGDIVEDTYDGESLVIDVQRHICQLCEEYRRWLYERCGYEYNDDSYGVEVDYVGTIFAEVE